jgi:sec-independent protein translocase protein TatB
VLNVGFGELLVVIVVCLIVFGPERLPEVARQLGRFVGRVRITTQRMLDELKNEAELRDLNLPDLKVGSLRTQARAYVQDLLDVEGHMAELEREESAARTGTDPVTGAPANGTPANGTPANGTPANGAAADGSALVSTLDDGPAPFDPDAT